MNDRAEQMIELSSNQGYLKKNHNIDRAEQQPGAALKKSESYAIDPIVVITSYSESFCRCFVSQVSEVQVVQYQGQ